jgi:hypothetical protein
LRRHAGDLGDDLLDLRLADDLLLLGLRQDALRRAGLVDDVDGLVRQVAVVDVAGGELGSAGQRVGRVLHAVMLLEAGLQALEDRHGFLDGGLVDVDLLEAPREGVVLLEDAAVLGVGGGADALQLAGGERRLEQVGGIQGAARGGAGADQGVDLVDEQDGVGLSSSCLSTALRRCSKSPRYLVPASRAPMSSA